MTYIDLFAGIGGFAHAAECAGYRWEKHFYSEIDDYACKVYEKRFPDAEQLGDIRKIEWERLRDSFGGEWFITGGFPCQDISIAGKRKGLIDEETGEFTRSGLWYEMHKGVSILRPRMCIFENVSAITIRGLDAVLSSLAEIGYDAEWQNIRASDVGAPHRRERIWIVAYPNSEIPNSDSARLERRPNAGCPEKIRTKRKQHAERQSELDRGENWAVEPDVGRVANGVPSRVDRLKCLGNAIVPQCAEIIFEELKLHGIPILDD
jgi:DNA (cytosine-5)-methyltransferase 1